MADFIDFFLYQYSWTWDEVKERTLYQLTWLRKARLACQDEDRKNLASVIRISQAEMEAFNNFINPKKLATDKDSSEMSSDMDGRFQKVKQDA